MGWIEFLDNIGIVVCVPVSLISLAFGAYQYLARRRKVHPVEIRAEKVLGAQRARIQPEIIIATFSGVFKPDGMSHDDYSLALKAGDWKTLKVGKETKSIGSTIALVEAYPSLRKLYLIASSSAKGTSSLDSVPVLNRYLREELERTIEVVTGECYAINLDEDSKVTEQAYRIVNMIVDELGKKYRPKHSKILVDVTAGTKSMGLGALFGCLRPDQDIHLIGTRYDENGNSLPHEIFPMIIHFRPARESLL